MLAGSDGSVNIPKGQGFNKRLVFWFMLAFHFSQRRQAARIGRLFSQLLDPASDLFSEQQGNLGWVAEELWEGAVQVPVLDCGAQHAPPTSISDGKNGGHGTQVSPKSSAYEQALAAAEAGGPDSDDDSDGSDDSTFGLPSFDVREDPEAEAWSKADPK